MRRGRESAPDCGLAGSTAEGGGSMYPRGGACYNGCGLTPSTEVEGKQHSDRHPAERHICCKIQFTVYRCIFHICTACAYIHAIHNANSNVLIK